MNYLGNKDIRRTKKMEKGRKWNWGFTGALLLCGAMAWVSGCQSGMEPGPRSGFLEKNTLNEDLESFSAKNLVPNGSFELGFDCGWTEQIRRKYWTEGEVEVYNPPRHPELDSSTVAEGKQSLRLSVPERGWGILSSPKLKLETDKTYTVSFYLKSDQESLPAHIGLGWRMYHRDKNVTKKVDVGKEWRRYSVSGKPGKSACHVRLDVYGPCTLWVDGVQMEKGEMSGYSAEAPIELGFHVEDISMQKKKRVYDKGDCISLSTDFIRHDPQVKKLKVEYVVLDYLKNERSFPSETIDFSGITSIKKQFVLPCDIYGTFKLRIAFDGGTAASKGFREFIYAVIPKQKNIDFCKDSPFACKAVGLRDTSQSNIDLLKRVGVKWVQLHSTLIWISVEKKKGEFAWHDFVVEKFHKRGFCILGELCKIPKWARKNPEPPKRPHQESYPDYYPKSFKGWNSYVAKTVSRYRNEIQAWNVWNEPYGRTNLTCGTEDPKPGTVSHPDYYVEILKKSYKTIKRVNPKATVLGCCIYPRYPKYLDAVLKNGALNYMDVLAIHDYTFVPPEVFGGGTDARVKTLRDLMRKYGEAKPIWNTEYCYGWKSIYRDRNINRRWYKDWPDTVTSTRGASRNIRLYLASLAVGVKKVFHFTINNFFEYDGAPSDTLTTYAAMTNILSERPKFVAKVDLADDVYCAVFQRVDGKYVAAFWTIGKPLELKLSLSSAAALHDIMGNKLSNHKKGVEFSVKVDYMPRYLLGEWSNDDEVIKDISAAGISGLQPLKITSMVINDQKHGLSLGLKAICSIPSSNKNMLHVKEHPANVKFKDEFLKIDKLTRGKAKKLMIPIKSVQPTTELSKLKGTLTTEDNEKYPVSIPFALITAGRAVKAKNLDGDPVDWQDAKWLEINRAEQVTTGYTKPTMNVTLSHTPIYPYWHGPKDSSGKVAVAWDSENLYFFFKVTDDKVNLDTATYSSDAIELFLDFDEYRDMDKSHYSDKSWQILLAPGTDGKLKASYQVVKPLGGKLRGLKMASRKTDKGYVLEVAIPLVNFNGFIPKDGRTIAFDVALDDRDSEKKRKTQMVWAGDQENWVLPSHFGSLLFLK